MKIAEAIRRQELGARWLLLQVGEPVRRIYHFEMLVRHNLPFSGCCASICEAHLPFSGVVMLTSTSWLPHKYSQFTVEIDLMFDLKRIPVEMFSFKIPTFNL